MMTRAERISELGYDFVAQPKEPMVPCNLCGADRWTVLTHVDRYGFQAQATACSICSLTVLNPRMTAEAYARFYETIYRPLVSAYHGRLIDAKTIKDDQGPYAEEMERFIAPFLVGHRGRTFLDIGGSTGVIAAHFAKRFGLQATVLDPAPDELAEAKALGIETVTGFVEDWDPGDRRFGVIGMFQTIDHLLDVKVTLKKIRQLLAPDGLFLVDVVDFRAVYLKNWSIEGAVKIDHPYSLTQDTAEAYFAEVGFDVVRRAYSADKHLIAYVLTAAPPRVDALPSHEVVTEFFREVRYVQSAPRGHA